MGAEDVKQEFVFDLVPPTKAAQMLGVAVNTLAYWRVSKRYALPYLKIGGKVMYRQADLRRFVEDRIQCSL